MKEKRTNGWIESRRCKAREREWEREREQFIIIIENSALMFGDSFGNPCLGIIMIVVIMPPDAHHRSSAKFVHCLAVRHSINNNNLLDWIQIMACRVIWLPYHRQALQEWLHYSGTRTGPCITKWLSCGWALFGFDSPPNEQPNQFDWKVCFPVESNEPISTVMFTFLISGQNKLTSVD